MKPLKDLKGDYASKEISDLVEFTSRAPIHLPENEKYHFEKHGTTVHIHGNKNGIKIYEISKLEKDMTLDGLKYTFNGVEINLKYGGVEKVILHSSPYQTTAQQMSPTIRIKKPDARTSPSESQNSGESIRPRHYEGESRTQRSTSPRESRTIRIAPSVSESRSRNSNSGSESLNFESQKPSKLIARRVSNGGSESRGSGESR
jgi:hypothetical protein